MGILDQIDHITKLDSILKCERKSEKTVLELFESVCVLFNSLFKKALQIILQHNNYEDTINIPVSFHIMTVWLRIRIHDK